VNFNTHAVCRKNIVALLDGELLAEQAHALNAHLGQCAECAQQTEKFRRLSEFLASWVPEPLSRFMALQKHTSLQEAADSATEFARQPWNSTEKIQTSGVKRWCAMSALRNRRLS